MTANPQLAEDLARWARATRPAGFTLRDVQREVPSRPIRREAAKVIAAAEAAALIEPLAPGSIVGGAPRKRAWRACDIRQECAAPEREAPNAGRATPPPRRTCDAAARAKTCDTAPAPSEDRGPEPCDTKRATPTQAAPCDTGLHPDAAALLHLIEERGPTSYGAAASDLGWTGTRAWRAEDRLSRAGLVHYPDRTGRMHLKR